jgi:quinol monooxygenase YgiN
VSTEVALIEVQDGRTDEFLEVLIGTAIPLLREGGAGDFTVYRSAEKQTAVVLVCEWPSPATRIEGFAKSPQYPKFLAILSEYLAGPPRIDDFDVVFTDH